MFLFNFVRYCLKEIITLFLNLDYTSGHSSTQLDRFGGNRHREKSETNSKSEPRLRLASEQ